MTLTRADKLTALLKAVLPGNDMAIDNSDWSSLPGAGEQRGGPCAPYQFDTRPDGTQRLTITNFETGEVVGVTGATRDELLDKLAARFAV